MLPGQRATSRPDNRMVTTRRTITAAQRRSRLAASHGLIPSAQTDDVAAIADSVVALHSTDPSTVYLSAMARMQRPSVEAVSTALYNDRTVVRHHAMRRTLWVCTPQTARWAHAACTTALAVTEWKRLAKMVEDSGVAADGAAWAATARADTLTALTSMGTATARQLGKAVPALTEKLHLAVDKSYTASQGAHTRLLLNLGLDGAIVRGRPGGTWTNSEYTWSVADQWLPGGIAGADLESAAAELARCYLVRFGPATMADLQWWARPDDDGLEAAGVVPRRSCRFRWTGVRPQWQCRPDDLGRWACRRRLGATQVWRGGVPAAGPGSESPGQGDRRRGRAIARTDRRGAGQRALSCTHAERSVGLTARLQPRRGQSSAALVHLLCQRTNRRVVLGADTDQTRPRPNRRTSNGRGQLYLECDPRVVSETTEGHEVKHRTRSIRRALSARATAASPLRKYDWPTSSMPRGGSRSAS